MKLPNYIKEAIIKSAKHEVIATKNNNLVRDWLTQNAPSELDWEDYLIDTLEQGREGSKEFIEFIESDGVIFK